MANGEITLAGAALAVALTALFIAIGQLLQQVFGTAEGYRRCQSSVLGPWARKTRLTWRWSQFRFEVKFTTPHLVLETNVPFQVRRQTINHRKTKRFVVAVDHTGSDASPIPSEKHKQENTDLVGWVELLKQLELLQQVTWNELRAHSPTKSSKVPGAVVLSPAMVLREWSWDFMPPEIVRPLATTTIGTLVVLAHRMGMVWRDLRPSRGLLRAEGNGHTFTSTVIRGFGTLVQYTYDDSYSPPSPEKNERERIPTEEADKLAFGIIPGDQALHLPDLHVIPSFDKSGDIAEEHTHHSSEASRLPMIASSLRSIGASEAVIAAVAADKHWSPILSNLRVMFCPFLPLRGSTISTVFNPLRIYVENLAHREARLVLRARLEQHLAHKENQSPALNAALDYMNTYASRWHWCYVNSFNPKSYSKGLFPLDLIEFLHDAWDEIRSYFMALESNEGIHYLDLVLAHLDLVLVASENAQQNISNGRHRDDGSIVGGPRSGTLVELNHLYADDEQQSVFFNAMEKRGVKNKQLVVEAWWMLVTKGMFFCGALWYLPTNEFPAVASAFYKSQTPVYIT